MAGNFEMFDHTADLGIRIRGANEREVFEAAPAALYAAIGRVTGTGEATTQSIELQADDHAMMLRDFMAELLNSFEVDGQVTAETQVELSDHTMIAKISMQSLDHEKSELQREVKAITYHDLSFTKTTEGCVAEVIVDI